MSGNIRQKVLQIVMLLLFAGLIISLRPHMAYAASSQDSSSKTASLEVTLKPQMYSIKLKWSKQPGAVKYKIYRADATKYVIDARKMPARRDYRYVGTCRGKGKVSFADKNARSGKYYAYVIRAYDKNNHKIADSFDQDSCEVACRGLGIPILRNNGYGENYNNTYKALRMYLEPDYYGVHSKNVKAVIYRKLKGQKKYKKLAVVKMGKNGTEFTDRTVKSGKSYVYKVQAVKKSDKKTCKSKKSAAVNINAVNLIAAYTVKCITPAVSVTDRDSLEVTFCVKNRNGHNGITTFKAISNEYYDAYYYSGEKGKEAQEYPFRLTAFSKDNVVWKKIPKGGVKLSGDKPLYLKGKILRGENEAIHFYGDNPDKESYIYTGGDILNYAGSGIGNYTNGSIDLTKGRGTAYQEWD